MIVVESYSFAVLLCIVTMLCWGSWANTQKLAGKEWRFELFYWDYVIGVLVLSVLAGVSLGNLGSVGRGFFVDIQQADPTNILSAMVGGVIFNAANVLLVAAIAIAGMSVAFPVGIGLALVLGVLINFVADPVGNPVYLLMGVALVVAAILMDAVAYGSLPGKSSGLSRKGLVLALLCGVLMGFFYRFVAQSMATDFHQPEAGKLGPYAAVFFFSLGLLLSNVAVNSLIMKKPFVGEPVAYSEYLQGGPKTHLIGILGGVVWGIGMLLSILASGEAGFAISYGLGQGATMVAAIWGVFIWKEFSSAPRSTGRLLALMFACYLAGLALIIAARVV